MLYKLPQEEKDKFHEQMLKLIRERNHVYISGKISENSRTVDYVVYCPKHDLTLETSFHNYKRSRTGCPHCGRDVTSSRLKGRVFSKETLEKMKISANTRPERGGKPRRWRETYSYYVWNAAAREAWNNECAVTGKKNVIPGDRALCVHHLMGAHSNANLVLVVENGIVLCQEIHAAFHGAYGYRDNTIAQFKEFLMKLLKKEIVVPISSQGEPGGSQGSETRVYDPERIMKLHERLSEIEAILEAVPSPGERVAPSLSSPKAKREKSSTSFIPRFFMI